MNLAFCSRFAWRFFKVAFRSGHLSLLMTSLVLAVAVVIGLTVFSDRVEQMLAGESRQFLAADKVLEASSAIPDSWLEEAVQRGLKQAQTLHFRSMLYRNDESMLVNVKAATENYPLAGSLSYLNTLDGEIMLSGQGPAVGEIWLSRRVFQKLALSVGDVVELGEAKLKVAAVLVSEPDAGAVAFSFSPKVLMNKNDIEKTDVVQVGSRITYRYLFSGPPKVLKRFEAWVLPQLNEHITWKNLESSQPGVSKALGRAETFLRLATSIVLILACFALAMTSLRFSRLQIKQVAVLKTLGVSSHHIVGIYLLMFLLILFVSLMAGFLFGYLLQEVLTQQVANQLGLEPALPHVSVWLSGLLVATIGFLGFALPPVWALKKLPAMAVFRQDLKQASPVTFWHLVFSGTALFAVLTLMNEGFIYSGILLCSVSMLIFLLALPIRLLLKSIVKTRSYARPWMLLMTSNLRRHMASNVLLVSVFSSCLMLGVILLGVKNNLFTSWQDQLPDNTPNFFMVNVQANELPLVKKWIQSFSAVSQEFKSSALVIDPVIYPMVRGRLTTINDQRVKVAVSKEDRDKAGVNRELNLSWSNHLPRDNRVVKGQWFDVSSKESTPKVSVEKKLANRLNIKLGDELGFSIGAEILKAKVTSIRVVDWDRMHPNFFMLFEESALGTFDATYMTSFYLPTEHHEKINALLDVIPTIVIVDLGAVIQQIRSIVAQVSTVLFVILVFVLIGCVFVLIATVQSSLDEREKENAVIRALGGSRRLIQLSLMIEFASLGAISGVLASISSELVLQVLQVYLLDIPLGLHVGLWWIAPAVAIVLITCAGFISGRKVIQSPPDKLLRQN